MPNKPRSKTDLATASKPEEPQTPKIDPVRLRRKREEPDGYTQRPPQVPESVSAGAVDKAIDLAFNPTREKLREVTIIDRVQGRLFPLLDIINAGRQFCLEVAMFRQSATGYRKAFDQTQPVPPNLLDDFLYRTAQWQKSVQGTNLTKITDIALAETETRVGDEENQYGGSADAWGKE